MGAYYYAVRKQSIVAKSKQYSKVTIRLAKFVGRRGYCCEMESKLERLLNQAVSLYARTEPAELIVLADSTDNLHGSTVYTYSGDGTIWDDYDLGQTCHAVGTLLGQKRNYTLETDKVVIEKLRREKEFQKMREGRLSIGAWGSNVEAYQKHLAQLDADVRASGKEVMSVRGHGF